MKAIKPFRKFFEECDMFSAPATLRIRDEPEMKSCGMGCLSFLVGCFFIYVFISNCVKVFNFEQINFSSSSTTIRSNQTKGSFQTFAITLDYLDFDTFSTMFVFKGYYYKNGTLLNNINLRPCTAEDWVLLGETYKTDFTDYYLNQMLCPSVVEQYQLNDTFRSATPDYISIQMQMCDSADPNCDQTAATNYITDQTSTYGSAQVWVFVLDKAIIPDQINPIEYFINIDTRAQVSKKFGGAAVVQFSNFQIDTDTNVLPWQIIDTQKGCLIDTVRTYQIGFDTITRVQFTLNQHKYIVSRVVGKLDDLLSYAGGLFSIIIGFFAFFLMSYNQYKYELLVAESSFSYDETGFKVKSDNFYFWHYVQYTIFDWINLLCCCTSNWSSCIKIDETREKVVMQLEADRLLRRLNNIERSIKQIMDPYENMIVNILCHPLIQKVEQDLHTIDYYNEIVNGRCPLALSEFIFDPNSNTVIMNQKKEESKNQKDSSMIETKNLFSSSSRIAVGKETITFEPSNIQDRLNILPHIVAKFPEIKEEAENIVLSQQFDSIEQKIAFAFFKLEFAKRRELQQQIPVIILIRLKSKGRELGQNAKNSSIAQYVQF